MTLLSVVIPSRDRPDLLRDCLVSLSRQSIAASLEVLVIDDGSRSPLSHSLAGASFPNLGVRFVREPPAGLNAARNRGCELSAAAVVAFLDDDTLVDPGWAEAVLDAFADPSCDAVGGRIVLAFEGPKPAWLVPTLHGYLSEFEEGSAPRWLDEGPVPVGANCAVRVAAWEAAGAFRTGLDRAGESLVSNGDTEFFRRMRAQGRRIRYEPRAAVRHRVPRERLTPEFFRRRAYAQGVSDQLLVQLGATPGRPRQLARESARLGRAVPIFAKAVARGQSPFVARLWIDYCRGRLATISRGSRP